MRKTSRRDFLRAGSAITLGWSAASARRVLGSNDRISIGMIGCGSRGREALMKGVHRYERDQNLEITAVADPWRLAREAAMALCAEWYGRPARAYGSYRDLLSLKDLDAVMIASCDHQHAAHLRAAAQARKDAYCEKPLAMTLKSLKSVTDAVEAAGIVVQIGTQLRSYPSMTGCKELYATGILGRVSRIEQCRNGRRPYWYEYLKEVREEDVDWGEFLMDAPRRPFRSDLYSGWYGYRDYSGGPVPGLASHFVDLVHYITGARFPESAVCHGGSFVWKGEHGFTCPDQVEATWVYPEGFLVHYSTNFGNGAGNTFKIFGTTGVMDLVRWDAPTISGEGASAQGKPDPVEPVPPVDRPEHILDWLQCLRSRKIPNAPIEAGYQHAVAVIMAMTAFDTGRRQVYDPIRREIRSG